MQSMLKPSIDSRLWLVLIGVLLAFSLVLTWMPALDVAAQGYLADALSDNLVIYASARAINALISVIQSIEVSLSLGAGVAVNLGEALDPLNDLIERFSSFVLYALAGLGLQQVILTASSSIFTKAVLSLFLIGSYLWWLFSKAIPNWLKRALLLLLMVRFAFAIEVGISWVLDKTYFELQQQEAVSTLDIAQNRLQTIRDQYMDAMEEKGLFSGIWTTAKSIIGRDSDGSEQGIADQAAGAIVQLIVIMLIRSMLLPLGYICIMVYIFRRLLKE